MVVKKIKKNKAPFLWMFVLLGFTPLMFAQEEAALISFKMKDQFNNEYIDQNFRDKIVVVIGSDKDGSKYNNIWGQAIEDSLKNKNGYQDIAYLPVADLRGVPFFLKGFVKGKFPKEPERWVLTDWKGKFPKTYQFEAKASNILIFDRDGKLVYQTYGHELETEKLSEILNVIVPLMPSGS
jgi:predicted transcriptional regulator